MNPSIKDNLLDYITDKLRVVLCAELHNADSETFLRRLMGSETETRPDENEERQFRITCFQSKDVQLNILQQTG